MRALATGGNSRLYVPWIILAAGCSIAMWSVPGEETVPYHLAWIGLAGAYGIEAWPWARTVYSVAGYTVVSGAILVDRAATGAIGWGEITEIPLMSILVLLVLWNVRTRHVAYGHLTRMAERDRLRAAQRERLSRMTSHEMRTPATIALGYADMLLNSCEDQRIRSDLLVICDELRRLVLVSDRVVRTMRMQDQDEVRLHDVSSLLRETGERWGVVADRHWVVQCEPFLYRCSAERLRASLDTLVENALRYTEEGDTIRIFGAAVGSRVVLGVADSGPGMDPVVLHAVNRGRLSLQDSPSDFIASDPKSQTGLGLALVREAAEARGGCLVAGSSAEGGALVVMALPQQELRPRLATRVSTGSGQGVPHAAQVSQPA
jgi:two-component system, OmpR family, sensor kinase